MNKISAWLLTDGKAGDEQQCMGVAEDLGLAYEIKRVRPRAPYTWLMPHGSIDPKDAPERPDSVIAPPFPDLVIASGRRAVPYLRAIKSASAGSTFTVFLKDPRTGTKAADFIWAPEHDKIRGPNVMTTLTSPHRIHDYQLAAARAAPDARIASLPSPKIAVLLGGDSKAYHFSPADTARLVRQLALISGTGEGLMVTASRRTPAALAQSVRAIIAERGGFFWDGEGNNPLIPMLANADHIIVTADSVNMVGEAVSTGKPVHIFIPEGGSRKTDRFLSGLQELGAIRPLTDRLESWSYTSINATPLIANEIERRYQIFRLGRDIKP